MMSEKILTRNFGRIDSHTLTAYLETGGYAAWPPRRFRFWDT